MRRTILRVLHKHGTPVSAKTLSAFLVETLSLHVSGDPRELVPYSKFLSVMKRLIDKGFVDKAVGISGTWYVITQKGVRALGSDEK